MISQYMRLTITDALDLLTEASVDRVLALFHCKAK